MSQLLLDIRTPRQTTQLSFERLPVRLGRGPECECVLGYAFVSRHHATLDVRDGALVVVDEGGRNAVLVGGRRLARGEAARLDATDGVFEIGLLAFRAVVARVSDDEISTAVPTVVDPPCPTRLYADESVDPRAEDGRAVARQARAALARVVAAAREARVALEQCAMSGVDGAELGEAVPGAVDEVCSELLGESVASTSAQRAAAEELRRLGRAAAIKSPQGATALATRLRGTLALLADGFVALRLVYRAETGAQADIDRIESGDDLVTLLLNEDRDTAALLTSVERSFVAMATHHARLVGEVNAGVCRMISTFDPAVIEAELPPGVPFFRYRRLWKELADRHARVRDDATGALGRRFEHAASALNGAKAHIPSRRATTIAPIHALAAGG